MNKSWREKLEKATLLLLLFLLPTQLALHFWPSWAFVFGIRVDLLAPAIYLTDILVVLLFMVGSVVDKKVLLKQMHIHQIFLGVFLAFITVNSVYSSSPPVTIYKWLKVGEFAFLAFYFAKQNVLNLSIIVKTLFYSAILFSVVGIFQFVKSATLGGLLYFLGERSFNMTTPGIALVSLNGDEHLRAYSTFSHPNSLAGFLGAALLFILLSGELKRTLVNLIGTLIILICFVLTFSISSYIGIFIAFAVFLFSKNKKMFKPIVIYGFLVSILGSLSLPLLSTWISKSLPGVGENVNQRLDLAFIAGKMISSRFLTGIGLGTFIVKIPTYKGIFSYSWLLQPVHNIYLLVLTETGIIGLLSFCLVIYRSLMNQLKAKQLYLLLPLIFILFTGLFDHYSLSLQQNILFLSILVGLSVHPHTN